MKKNYSTLLSLLSLFTVSVNTVEAQCTAPAPPAVSGSTVAACVSSSAFTLTASGTGTNPVGWYANSFGGNALSTNSVFTSPTLTSGATYYVGQASGALSASMTLPAQASIYTGHLTRGFWFTAPVDFIITGLRVPLDITGTANSGIAVMKFSAVPPTYATTTSSFNTLYLDQAITGTNVVAVNIPIYAGDIIGILGERGSDVSYAASPYTSTLGVGTNTLTLTRLGMQYDLANTTPQDLWTEVGGSIGRVEVYTTIGCNSTLTPVIVTVIPAPNVVIAAPPRICANSSYTLNATGATTYTWSGGPQTSAYVVNPSTTTTYSVMGSIQSTCNSSLTAVTISVDPAAPTVTASSSSSMVCSGNTLALTGAGATSYSWSGSAVTPTNGIVFIPSVSQTYTLVGSNSCGTGSATINVPVNPTPTLMTAASSSAVCDGQTATLTVTGASTYTWEGINSGSTFVITPSVTAAYNVIGLSSAGCFASAAHPLILYPNPVVNAITNKTIVCSAGSATLTANGANIYNWSTTATNSVTVVNPVTSTVYTVTGTYTSTGCASSKTVEVAVFIPNLQVSSSATVCDGSVVTLTAGAGAGSTYTWSNGTYFYANNITATVAAIYTVTVKTSTPGASNCTTTATVELGIYPNPTITVAATRTAICKGEKLVLTANGGSTYTWPSLGAATRTVQVGPTIVNSVTIYTATGIDANGCASNGTFAVKVNACTGLAEYQNDESSLNFYPNPNNGNFVIEVKSQMQLSLVNQLGQVVRELSFNQENEYKQNVTDLSNGIYFIKGLNGGSAIQNKIVVSK
ncbi:hypothetical protein CNR22_22160 [Sphingobacteriaceae bacterium]|nr:hypothetical protein CNR22_22160 [Sphingobacteriaceae bacterium]